MKPYTELTRQGRLRRMRQVARAALAQYGLAEARFQLLRQAGNTLFRVHAPAPAAAEAGELFEPGQYLLRVHEPGYQEPAALELELAWLAAMRREADLPVQEPVPTLDGRLLLPVSVPGVPQTRHCSLLRWIKARPVRHARPQHLRAQGRLMARLHNFAAEWQPPAGRTKRQFDWAGLFSDDVGSGMPNAEAWALLPAPWRAAFAVVAQRVREVMDAWGQGPDVYGLIHGDLGVDANLLFWRGEPRPIDFDDSGYGYWVYDLAVGLEHCWQDAAFPRYRDALLAGYAEHRALPDEQLAQLELFIAATEVYWNLWAAGGTHLYPQYRAEWEERIQRTAGLVVRYVERGNPMDAAPTPTRQLTGLGGLGVVCLGQVVSIPIAHKEIAPLQIAGIKTVVEKRVDILPLFERLRAICGEAICGPAMAVYHYGEVPNGFLVEAAFPVGRPIETDPVHTRQIEGARAVAIVHRGPLETVRETIVRLHDYARAHAGAAGGQREVYLTLDLEHPEQNVIEIQLIRHEWDRLLSEGVEEALGAAAREQVMAGIEQITPESPSEAYAEWIRGAMDRLDALTDDPVKKYQAVSCCAHVFPDGRIAHLRALYEQRHQIDDVLREMYQDPAWYEDPVRKGNVLYMRKVPFDPEGYEKGATPAERRKAYCHCAFVRPYLDEVPSRLSPTFCWCGSGWYRRLWEGILGRPIQVEHVETLIQGHDQCTLRIILPLELTGEMRRTR